MISQNTVEFVVGNVRRELKDDVQCSICIEDFVSGEILRRLRCLHHFHKSCVDEWLARRADCPVCRLSIVSES